MIQSLEPSKHCENGEKRTRFPYRQHIGVSHGIALFERTPILDVDKSIWKVPTSNQPEDTDKMA